MKNDLKIKNHIKRLKKQHEQIDGKLVALKDTSIDDLEINKLKKTKLYIKDQITRFKNMLGSR